MKTHHDGVAIVVAQNPSFTSGRAAILIKALAWRQCDRTAAPYSCCLIEVERVS
ncbi:MAG: hypothetical protein H0T64_10300 [Pyrinomonadaceae bacterium]|nr:hypothetical protein [Pyrinomonadaceae bacterium]